MTITRSAAGTGLPENDNLDTYEVAREKLDIAICNAELACELADLAVDECETGRISKAAMKFAVDGAENAVASIKAAFAKLEAIR